MTLYYYNARLDIARRLDTLNFNHFPSKSIISTSHGSGKYAHRESGPASVAAVISLNVCWLSEVQIPRLFRKIITQYGAFQGGIEPARVGSNANALEHIPANLPSWKPVCIDSHVR